MGRWNKYLFILGIASGNLNYLENIGKERTSREVMTLYADYEPMECQNNTMEQNKPPNKKLLTAFINNCNVLIHPDAGFPIAQGS